MFQFEMSIFEVNGCDMPTDVMCRVTTCPVGDLHGKSAERETGQIRHAAGVPLPLTTSLRDGGGQKPLYLNGVTLMGSDSAPAGTQTFRPLASTCISNSRTCLQNPCAAQFAD